MNKKIIVSDTQTKIINAYNKIKKSKKVMTNTLVAKLAKCSTETARVNLMKLSKLKLIK